MINVGDKVLIRSRYVKGRNKIQDHWNSLPLVIISRPDSNKNLYQVKPVDGAGKSRFVNRRELLLLPNFESGDSTTDYSSSSDSYDFKLYQNSREVSNDTRPSTNTSYSSDDSDSPMPIKTVPLKRSTRSTKGKHSNPHNLPRSACKNVLSTSLKSKEPTYQDFSKAVTSLGSGLAKSLGKVLRDSNFYSDS